MLRIDALDPTGRVLAWSIARWAPGEPVGQWESMIAGRLNRGTLRWEARPDSLTFIGERDGTPETVQLVRRPDGQLSFARVPQSAASPIRWDEALQGVDRPTAIPMQKADVCARIRRRILVFWSVHSWFYFVQAVVDYFLEDCDQS
jgi:hypothetical protein